MSAVARMSARTAMKRLEVPAVAVSAVNAKRRACLNGGEPIQIEEPEIVPPARTLDSQNALRLFVDSSSSIRRAFGERVLPASAACRRSKSPRRVQSGAIPLEAVRALIGDAVPILTRDPLSAAKSFVEESAEREELEQLTDRQLLRRAAREVAIAVCWSPKRCCAKRPWC
jgi:hypothetical protein